MGTLPISSPVTAIPRQNKRGDASRMLMLQLPSCFVHVKLASESPFQGKQSMKFGVIIFPGSNCDHDAFWTVEKVLKQPVTFLWHESHGLENCDAIIVPGGFAYGD